MHSLQTLQCIPYRPCGVLQALVQFLQTWYISYRPGAFLTGLVHSLQTWCIAYRPSVFLTGLVYSLQTWQIPYSAFLTVHSLQACGFLTVHSLPTWQIPYSAFLTGMVHSLQDLFSISWPISPTISVKMHIMGRRLYVGPRE